MSFVIRIDHDRVKVDQFGHKGFGYSADYTGFLYKIRNGSWDKDVARAHIFRTKSLAEKYYRHEDHQIVPVTITDTTIGETIHE